MLNQPTEQHCNENLLKSTNCHGNKQMLPESSTHPCDIVKLYYTLSKGSKVVSESPEIFSATDSCTFKINCVAKCFCNVFPWKQAMRFYVKKIGIIQVVLNKEDFDRSNAPINEGVIPEASYHFQKKDRRTKLKNFIDWYNSIICEYSKKWKMI